MEIERINENTVKFYLSYIDIEERGFSREEVWYNRDKSEELFWEMMEEINDETEFEIEGPLWIQVHAMNSGIEVTVTRAQLPSDSDEDDFSLDAEHHEKEYNQDDSLFGKMRNISEARHQRSEDWTADLFVFSDLDHLILLADQVREYTVGSSLYSYGDNYYLFVTYEDEMDDTTKTNFCSVVTEFGSLSNMTIHRLEEYGTSIIQSDALATIDQYFG